MANDEIKKVITVDLGNTSTSLKEYKQHIDDLRGSLLQLDETSEEYQNIAQEITDEQNKLNEVMKVGKGYTDAAEGSYNQLAKTMSELKKQWRATTDETERADLGKQILEINDKLKELDASTGNFQRNVGDYSTAFEKAFDKCLDGIKTIDGPLGELGGTVKNLIPVIQSVNKAAIGGLTGIKAAIASTGIGLLVVGVGELATHWEEVYNWLQKVTGAQKDYNNALYEGTKEDYFKSMNDSFSKKLEEDSKNIANDIQNIKEQISALNKEKAEIQQKYDDLLEQATDSRFSKYEKDIAIYKRQQLKDEMKLKDQQLSIAKTRLDELEKLDKDNAAQRLKAFNESIKSERTKLKEEYDANIEAAQKLGVDTTSIRQKYNDDLKKLDEKEAAERANITKTAEQKQKEQEEQQVQEILDRIEYQTTAELVKLEERYKAEKALLEKYGKSTVELTRLYEDERAKILYDSDKKAYEQRKTVIENELDEVLNSAINGIYSNLDRAESFLDKLFNTDEIDVDAVKETITEIYNLRIEGIQAQIDANNYLLENFVGSEAEKQRLIIETNELMRQSASERIKKEIEVSETTQKAQKMRKDAIIASVTASSKVMGDLFDNMSSLAKEGSKESKVLAIMSATINAFGSAVGAYKSASEIPYVGWIMAPIAAASALAAGMANVKQIKATNESSSGSESAAASSTTSASSMLSASMAEVSPLLNEQNDLNRMTTISETGESSKQQNMRVYVVDQDIRDANAHAVSVEENATF